MRIVSDHPPFVLVTGVARSGTTLLASILNSCENAVVLSEPHNSIRTHGWVRQDKLGEGTRQMKVEEVVPWLSSSPHDLKGVKEVCEFTRERDCIFLDYVLDKADLVLVTVRDPVEVCASQKSVLNFTLAESLVILSRFMGWYDFEKKRRKMRLVQYEDLCADPTGYLNNAVEEFKIEGEFAKLKMKGFGDARALNSTEVKLAPSRKPEISEGATLAINAVCGEWFEGAK